MDEYDPMVAPDPEEWLAMDEGERLALIRAYVEECEPGIEGEMMHVGMHMMVENQIAMGDEIPVREGHERLMGEGLDRHEAIHAVAMAFAHVLSDAKGEPDAGMSERYYEELENITAETWRASGGDNEEAHQPARPKAPVGRNEPCPCGSGKKYKKCCWAKQN